MTIKYGSIRRELPQGCTSSASKAFGTQCADRGWGNFCPTGRSGSARLQVVRVDLDPEVPSPETVGADVRGLREHHPS